MVICIYFVDTIKVKIMLRVQKWGNSAAVRLPADMLKQLDFK
ncbi:AbrB/MazE/SpoVT family DNA-binding domain-containing protein, partial [Neisseria meningitidis]